MKAASVIVLLGIAGLIGWNAPDLGDSASRPAAAPASAAADKAAWNAGQTVLQRQGDGHFYADAAVGDAQVRFLVDTGASVVALTGEDARAAGLDWDETALRPIGRGASGVVQGVPVTIERIELGGFEATDVEAAIIPDGLPVSLLGQSFLSRMSGAQIDGDEMRLGG
ncbi:MAG TPA: TIGR02281 family clan AA aspartic protease [Novosphingobium sp.]|nr:TIGR02281 family clan AA aspartic protease [Novosphingobium sp.]